MATGGETKGDTSGDELRQQHKEQDAMSEEPSGDHDSDGGVLARNRGDPKGSTNHSKRKA